METRKGAPFGVSYFVEKWKEGGERMAVLPEKLISELIVYVEAHLYEGLNLDQIAAALHYSKYYLHRTFRQSAGLTIHEYVQRRRLTEAARMLVFSEKTVLDIAQLSGYESQQAFTDAFRSMYKMAPVRFRNAGMFYPLQLQYTVREKACGVPFHEEEIRQAQVCDIPEWMELVGQSIDGYPRLVEADYVKALQQSIAKQQAMLLPDGHLAAGAMIYSGETGRIEFLAVHPQYRGLGVTRLFLNRLLDRMAENLSGMHEISITTFRAGDRADTGYRDELLALGFSARELLVEFGYPTQRFVFSPPAGEVHGDGQTYTCTGF